MTEEKKELFAVYAVCKNEPTPLIQTHLSFGQLMDDIVMPFESSEMFFIDGAAVRAMDIFKLYNDSVAKSAGALASSKRNRKKDVNTPLMIEKEGV